MFSLFIDTSDSLTFGLLDQGKHWKAFKEMEEKRNSFRLHGQIDDLLRNHGLTWEEVGVLFQAAGPGSYTGMRVSEGFSSILEFLGKKIFSFHHFQVPFLLGVESGLFLTTAFKGEIFVYEWAEGGEGTTTLWDKEEFLRKVSAWKEDLPRNIYCPSPSALEILQKYGGPLGDFPFQFTQNLLREHPQALFEKVAALALRCRPYYFRPLEKEFRCSGDESSPPQPHSSAWA